MSKRTVVDKYNKASKLGTEMASRAASIHHKGPLDIRLMNAAMSDIRDCFEMLPGDEHLTRDHLLEIVEQRIDFLKLMITKSKGAIIDEEYDAQDENLRDDAMGDKS